MKNITEYLSAKEKIKDEKYYVILPGNAPYNEIRIKYSDEKLRQHKLSTIDYWVFSSSKLLEILKPFESDIRSHKYLFRIWEVPEEYKYDIEKFKKEFEDSDKYPESYLKEIDYDEIL